MPRKVKARRKVGRPWPPGPRVVTNTLSALEAEWTALDAITERLGFRSRMDLVRAFVIDSSLLLPIERLAFRPPAKETPPSNSDPVPAPRSRRLQPA